MKKALTAALGIAAMAALPTAAQAQGDATAGADAFVGVSAGYPTTLA